MIRQPARDWKTSPGVDQREKKVRCAKDPDRLDQGWPVCLCLKLASTALQHAWPVHSESGCREDIMIDLHPLFAPPGE
jgi:hypothetical protein